MEKQSSIRIYISLIDLLFCQMPAERLLRRSFSCDRIPVSLVAKWMGQSPLFNHQYSDLECESIARAVSDDICDQRGLPTSHGFIHVFALLSKALDPLLFMQDGQICCHYSQILHWRELTRSIGEELPVTLAYLFEDLRRGEDRRDLYSWDCVIGQNNHQLNTLLQRGISEHHFHLWLSAPYFQVSWLNLMNCVSKSEYTEKLWQIDFEDAAVSGKDYLEMLLNGTQSQRMLTLESLPVQHMQAALIRLYLFLRLSGSLQEDVFYFPGLPKEFRRSPADCLQYLLTTPNELVMYSSEIQSRINSLMDPRWDRCADYALLAAGSKFLWGQQEYQIFAGERWLIYQAARDIYMKNGVLSVEEQNLFYLYLLLSIRIRSKIVQVNQKIGFDNFQRYQNRKDSFVSNPLSQRIVARLAIKAPLEKMQHLQELEIRISPKSRTEDNFKLIQWLERSLQDFQPLDNLTDAQCKAIENLSKRHYYVFHFPKKADVFPWNEPSQTALFSVMECRHYQYRKRLDRWADVLIRFREKYPLTARMVRGIDACSQEIGCRPEVFAPVFRRLNHHTKMWDDLNMEFAVPQLGKTFHVGEDFLDPADGLRAIDEAIRFLGMNRGDRLGHALALGVDVEDWYQGKGYQITMTVQDYIDNLAWLYHALRRYQIEGMEELSWILEREFDPWFQQVYLNHISAAEIEAIGRAAIQEYGQDLRKQNYGLHARSFDISDYYHAWSLRGDHPVLYQNGYYHTDFRTEEYFTNQSYPHDFARRYMLEPCLLNYWYHYNAKVKRSGSRRITVTVSPEYVQGVKAVQRAMCFEVAQRGIFIETNPSSNVLISTFRRYEKHPLSIWYNKGLTHDHDALNECAQLHVSINTDDMGTFFTNLENEYAFLARAQEEAKSEDGKSLYSISNILEWLDAIRIMGNEQGFKAKDLPETLDW